MPNTLIPVMYRDANNYKIHGTLVADGAITPTEIETLKKSLSDGEYYLPLQLGLDYYGTDWSSYDPDDSDHPWHEMLLDDIEVEDSDDDFEFFDRHVERVGAVDVFVRKIAAASSVGWDTKRYSPDAS